MGRNSMIWELFIFFTGFSIGMTLSAYLLIKMWKKIPLEDFMNGEIFSKGASVERVDKLEKRIETLEEQDD